MTKPTDEQCKLWEVFIQTASNKAFEHVGQVHGADQDLALQNARDVYARRGKVKCLWVVNSSSIHASDVGDPPWFDQSFHTPYRHPQFYSVRS